MNVKNYKNRFFSLLESEMGDVRPLVNESDNLYSEEEMDMMVDTENDFEGDDMGEMTYVGFDIKTNFPHSSESEKMKQVMDAEKELRDLISQAGMELYRKR
jgi:hypothetical protein